jgi:lipopolysaccharide/colanic/teichoic acid biosynthesis glycosyltransferase
MDKYWMKRAFDLSVALFCAPIALPVVATAATAVKLDSHGPAFFLQERIGKEGRSFTIFKLRTMVDGAASMGAGLYFEQNDPRFTRVGLLLRRYSIDELPQLWNVVRGDMSIPGQQ